MHLSFDEAELRPLIEATVKASLEQVEDDRAKLGARLAFSEAEAAALLGVKTHVLRDCRLRGEIQTKKVGKSFRYSREQLVQFMGSTASGAQT